MSGITSKPDHSDGIVSAGKASGRLQLFFDDVQQRLNDFLLGITGLRFIVYAKADLPTPSDATKRYMVFVTDDAGGSTPAFWDGTNWRRTSDRTIIA